MRKDGRRKALSDPQRDLVRITSFRRARYEGAFLFFFFETWFCLFDSSLLRLLSGPGLPGSSGGLSATTGARVWFPGGFGFASLAGIFGAAEEPNRMDGSEA